MCPKHDGDLSQGQNEQLEGAPTGTICEIK